MFISGRNYFTDAAAYAPFYAPELVKLTNEDRLRFMKRVSGLPDYDQIYFMRIDPTTAFNRIRARMLEERIKPTGQPSWRHRHESMEGLTFLVKKFAELPKAVGNVFPGTEVIGVDACAPKHEVAEFIANNLKARLEPKLGKSS